LQFLAGLTTSRTITLNQGEGTFDTNGNNVTPAGAIGGNGELIKLGAGTLTLSHANTYSGETALDAGTLDVAALGAAGTGKITFATGSEALNIENAALSNHNFANTILDFGNGDLIDLIGLAFALGAKASYNARADILKVTSHGVTDTLTLVNPASANFMLQSDGNGGTEIVLTQSAGHGHDMTTSDFVPLVAVSTPAQLAKAGHGHVFESGFKKKAGVGQSCPGAPTKSTPSSHATHETIIAAHRPSSMAGAAPSGGVQDRSSNSWRRGLRRYGIAAVLSGSRSACVIVVE
jgi:autotransporter-associated beta strand protein